MQFASHFFVVLFLVGLVGSLSVIVITFIEDLELLFDDEESSEPVG